MPAKLAGRMYADRTTGVIEFDHRETLYIGSEKTGDILQCIDHSYCTGRFTKSIARPVTAYDISLLGKPLAAPTENQQMFRERFLKCVPQRFRYLLDSGCRDKILLSDLDNFGLHSFSAMVKHYLPMLPRKTAMAYVRSQAGPMINLSNFLAYFRHPVHAYEHLYKLCRFRNLDKSRDCIRMIDSIREQEPEYNYVLDSRWSQKRWDIEHDKLVRISTLARITPEQREPFQLGGIFSELEIPDWLTLLKSPAEVILEGQEQQHCVGSYVNKIKNGGCIILSTKYEGKRYTIEVTKSRHVIGGVRAYQIKGRRNDCPPRYLRDMVDTWIGEENIRLKATMTKEYDPEYIPLENNENDLSGIRTVMGVTNEMARSLGELNEAMTDWLRSSYLTDTIQLMEMARGSGTTLRAGSFAEDLVTQNERSARSNFMRFINGRQIYFGFDPGIPSPGYQELVVDAIDRGDFLPIDLDD